MKLLKSLTCLFALILVSACNGHSSAAFSSTSENTSSENSSSLVDSSNSSSSESSSNVSSSSEIILSSETSSSSESSLSSNSSSSYDDTPINRYDGYYDSLQSWNNGEDLKNQLYAIMRNGYTPLSYTKSNKQNYDSNVHADHEKYDFETLDVIYSSNSVFKNETNKGWQREHAWCASLMCGTPTGSAVSTKGRATDFHNLFAAEAGGNQSRGNKNYGEADKTAISYVDRTTNSGLDGYSFDETTFEPANIDKGRVARAIFYMATMYKDAEDGMDGLRILEEPVKYPFESGREYAIGNLSTLLSWNNTYQVDYLEMQHNIAVYSDSDNPDGVAQGNRNPFVDYPGLVDYVFGNKKDQAGNLEDLVASSSYLGSEDANLSHYALKQAKREYEAGETLKASDYVVVGVKNNFSYEVTTVDIVNVFDDYTFKESDGTYVNIDIVTPINNIRYRIILSPMGVCSSGILMLTTTGINKKTPDVDQNISIGSVPFLFNFSTTFSTVSTDGMTINNISAGGVTVGSNPRPLTKLVIKTKNTYTVDKIYIKAQAGNASSSYSLSIKVGDEIVNTKTVSDSTAWKVFGGDLEQILTGQISFVFTGSTSLKINSIAFNSISS